MPKKTNSKVKAIKRMPPDPRATVGAVNEPESIKVFLSWSGKKSHYVAKLLKSLLEDLFGDFIRVWISDDMGAGRRWVTEIVQGLDKTQLGIICVTKSNQTTPWILYEAGAIAGRLTEGNICPFLIDLAPSDLSGPLSQFQAVQNNEAGLRKLVSSISMSVGLNNEAKGRIDRLLDALWQEFNQNLDKSPADEINPGPEKSDVDILREILDTLRLQTRYLISLGSRSSQASREQCEAGTELEGLLRVRELLARAKLKRDGKDFEGAIQDFRKALEVDPTSDEAEVGILVTQSYQVGDDGSYQDIIRHLEQLAAGHPRPSKALYNLACILNLERGRQKDESLTERVFANLRKAIELYPQYRDIARHDIDFKDLSNHSQFVQLTSTKQGLTT
jgi:tetratricopeptide (TPR) repeat protein